MSVATTKLSSRGQVVIPEKIRKSLKLKEGDEFAVTGRGGRLLLEKIESPRFEDAKDLVAEVRRAARKAGIKKADIEEAIRYARRK